MVNFKKTLMSKNQERDRVVLPSIMRMSNDESRKPIVINDTNIAGSHSVVSGLDDSTIANTKQTASYLDE